MPTLLIHHAAALDHQTPPGHPERADRIRAVEKALADPAFAALRREEAPLGRFGDALSCHEADYIAELEIALPSAGLVALDADTTASPGSREACCARSAVRCARWMP